MVTIGITSLSLYTLRFVRGAVDCLFGVNSSSGIRKLALQSPVVTICTASLIFNNSTFCPHRVFMCFVWIWEQTPIISLYSINWLVFITETKSVYFAVRTRSLYVIQATLRLLVLPWLRRCSVAWCHSRDPGLIPGHSILPKVALGKFVLSGLRFSPVSIIPSTSRTRPHFYTALIRRTNGQSLGTFQKATLFRKSSSTE